MYVKPTYSFLFVRHKTNNIELLKNKYLWLQPLDMALNLSAVRDTKWLTLEVCRQFQRGNCSRSDEECKFAHPPKSCQVENGRVIACFDSLKVRNVTHTVSSVTSWWVGNLKWKKWIIDCSTVLLCQVKKKKNIWTNLLVFWILLMLFLLYCT